MGTLDVVVAEEEEGDVFQVLLLSQQTEKLLGGTGAVSASLNQISAKGNNESDQ